MQKERRTLLAKRLDLDAAKSKLRKAQSPERMQQVCAQHTLTFFSQQVLYVN